ncbi:DUF2779 domain-containing protein [Paucibacter sp. DJ4R-1]|nr:DUF2779 domain-containing protein [Paucibacter sp. DJ4R-1]
MTARAPRELSKSKLIAFRQCPKRLWLELHQPDKRSDSAGTQRVFQTGHEVGEIAWQLYDPQGTGTLVDIHAEGWRAAIARTATLLASGPPQPIFEAGFAAGGAMAFADVLLPAGAADPTAWRMVEVKSSTSVKDYHRDDLAVQSFVAREAGLHLSSVALAHIDTTWTYPGDGDYRGLLVEKELGDMAVARSDEVRGWIAQAQAVAAMPEAPELETGPHCEKPFACGFIDHCRQDETTAAEFPVAWLPRLQSKAAQDYVQQHGVTDMREMPDALLNERQRRVRTHTLAGTCYFDLDGAQRELARHPLPAYFLDFETIQFGVPRWAGTRPFQSLPFQFSAHHLDAQGTLTHQEFLDTSGADHSMNFARELLAACPEPGPIFVYNAGFEGARIAELAQRFPAQSAALLALKCRLVDLLPIAERYFYHPSQQGSWSIKKLLPAIAPELPYETLDGVQDGEMAMQAYLEASDPDTTPARSAQIRTQLSAYCALDTLALVRVWKYFNG